MIGMSLAMGLRYWSCVEVTRTEEAHATCDTNDTAVRVRAERPLVGHREATKQKAVVDACRRTPGRIRQQYKAT